MKNRKWDAFKRLFPELSSEAISFVVLANRTDDPIRIVFKEHTREDLIFTYSNDHHWFLTTARNYV